MFKEKVRRAARFYLEQLDQHPCITRMLTAGGVLGVADVIAQLSEGGRGGRMLEHILHLDGNRMARYASYGFWVMGSFQVVWYLKVAPTLRASTRIKTVGLKLLVENCVATVVINSIYLLIIPLLAMRTIEQSLTHCKSNILKTLKASWSFWPLMSSINYIIFPPKLQPLFASVCTLIWQSFLNLTTNRSV